jgi:hypothetical protein
MRGALDSASMFCRKAILPIPCLSIQPKTGALIDAIGWERKRTAPRPRQSQSYRWWITLLGNGGEPVDGADGSVFLIALR